MSTLAAIVALASFFLGARSFWLYHMKRAINQKAFLTQIAKLIQANRIDHAVKLCNVRPSAPLASSVRKLLLKSNRPHELELVLNEIEAELSSPQDQARMLRLTAITGVINVFGVFAMTYFVHVLAAQRPLAAVIWPLVYLTGRVLLNAAQEAARQVTDWVSGCVYVRNLLYTRTDYVPPKYRPVFIADADEELVHQWRAAMRQFEIELEGMRSKGRTVNAREEHDNRVDENGVLPPL